jgi:FtsH-binding integral membrane protein
MYNQSSVFIVAILFISLIVAMEVGYRIGRKVQTRADAESKSHVNAIQTSLLGVLALLLGFTFSLALQRYDSRSVAVVDEANAIGTAYLRSQLLPLSVRDDVQQVLRDYIDVRVQESTVSLASQTQRQVLLKQATENQADLWQYAVLALEEDDRPATTGLFIQSLNELINSYGRRNAALNRHLPEDVLFLLFGTFIMTWAIVGYASGVAGHRTSFVAYVMLVLIVLLVFIIIDLDRPRRGLIEINHTSLTDLQAIIDAAVCSED